MVAPVITLPSKKHSGISGMNTQLFVQHSGETPLRGGYAQSLTTANNANASWQASWPSFVDPIARVRQIAWPNSAWTQGYANAYSVGLECAGYAHFSAADWLTAEGLKQIENLAHEWVYYWKKEQAVGNTIALRWLSTAEVQKVMAGNRSINGFCTHRQIDPAARTDPGPNFPYDRLMNRIKQLLGKSTTTASAPAEADDLMDWISTVFKDKAEFRQFLLDTVIDGGVGYNGADGKDNDLWSKTNSMPDDVAYQVVREPITVTDWKDGETKVKAQMASFLGTTWNQVHRMHPARFREILANQARVLAILEELAKGSGVDMAAVEAAAAAGAEQALREWDQTTAEEIATAVVDEQAERLTPEATA